MTSIAYNYTPASRVFQYAAIAAMTIILSNWQIYHNAVHGGPIPLIYYFIVFPIAIWAAFNKPNIDYISRNIIVYWLIVYAISGAVWVTIYGEFSDEENRLIRARVLSLLIFLSGLFLVSICETVYVVRMLLVSSILAALNNWIDFLNPYLFYPVDFTNANPGRGSGFYINANQAGQAVVALCITLWPFISNKYRNVLMLIMIFGVIPTFSRSAIIFSIFAVLITIWFGRANAKQMLWVAFAAVLLVFIGTALYDIAMNTDQFSTRDIEQRLDFFSTGGQAFDASANERKYVAAVAYDMFAQSPFFGNGIGSTLLELRGRGVHNMYLVLLAEQGIIGLILFLIFLVLIFIRGFRFYRRGVNANVTDIGVALMLMAGLIAFFGLFSHTIFEDPFSLLLLSILLFYDSKNTYPNDLRVI
jgi:O-antigen ligase